MNQIGQFLNRAGVIPDLGRLPTINRQEVVQKVSVIGLIKIAQIGYLFLLVSAGIVFNYEVSQLSFQGERRNQEILICMIILPIVILLPYVLKTMYNEIRNFRQNQRIFNQIEIYQVGLDVHIGHRDLRVLDAYKKLQQSQGHLTLKEIYLETDAFVEYLNKSNSSLKEKAFDALYSPKIGEFGGLFIENDFTILNFPISGEEVIARLWRFCNQYIPSENFDNVEIERENGRVSMVGALGNSYHKMGGLICNQGKVQQLIVGVLQGRLDGVQIEECLDNQEISKEILINAFSNFPDVQSAFEEGLKERIRDLARTFSQKSQVSPETRAAFLNEIEEMISLM